MITCPSCGQKVSEGQRFCGWCGTDVQAVPRPPQVAAAAHSTEEQPDIQYAYNEPSGYGYDMPPMSEGQRTPRMVVLIVALLLAVACAFCCGLIFGFEIIPDILGLGSAAPATKTTPVPATPVPTGSPTSLLFIAQYLIG